MAIFFAVLLLLLSSSTAPAAAGFPPRFADPVIGSRRQPRQWDNMGASLLRSGESEASYETKYYTQNLDHFDYTLGSYTTFQQRYLVNDDHWGGAAAGAPIFVYTGNEGDIEWFANNTGFMFDVAPRFKALLVFIEHRYYGKSLPFGKEAFVNASTIGYLSTTQALADFATLIVDLKKNLTAEKSPVVVFGGSYGGMLAAWFRLKYPHITIGALASSAPILQFEDIISPYSFDNIITKDFRGESENCYQVIKNSWKEFDDVSTQESIDKLAESFKICKGVPRDANLPDMIVNWIQNALVYVAMTDYPTPSDFLASLPAYPVKKMCEAIDNPTTGNDTFARLYGAMNIYYNNTGTAKCFLDPSSSGTDDIGYDSWFWQACTELILPTGGNTNESIFPAFTYNYTEQLDSCQQLNKVPPRPHWITTEFGGRDIKRVLRRFASNIIFSNGLRDPWSGGGVLKSLSNSLRALVAPLGAHHGDLRFATTEDPEWLTKMRKIEIRIITRWLHQYYKDSKSV